MFWGSASLLKVITSAAETFLLLLFLLSLTHIWDSRAFVGPQRRGVYGSTKPQGSAQGPGPAPAGWTLPLLMTDARVLLFQLLFLTVLQQAKGIQENVFLWVNYCEKLAVNTVFGAQTAQSRMLPVTTNCKPQPVCSVQSWLGEQTPGALLFGQHNYANSPKEGRDCSPLLSGKNNMQTNHRAFLNAAMIYK